MCPHTKSGLQNKATFERWPRVMLKTMELISNQLLGEIKLCLLGGFLSLGSSSPPPSPPPLQRHSPQAWASRADLSVPQMPSATGSGPNHAPPPPLNKKKTMPGPPGGKKLKGGQSLGVWPSLRSAPYEDSWAGQSAEARSRVMCGLQV